MTDPLLLSVCISNIITNSVVHSTKGEFLMMNVRERLVSEKYDPTFFLNIAFEDNGIGIPADEMLVIFGLFRQGKASTTGDGIGLPFARLAANLLGGEIWVDTAYHQGAAFVLSLPYER